MLNDALSGIKVLDFSQGIAGPMGAGLLREMGAEVIKIEPPSGDWLRGLGHRNDETSILFSYFNRGKKSIVLNLKKQTDIDAAHTLIRKADVLIESNRPGVSKRLGLDYELIKEINPNLIYISVTGFGQHGLDATQPATDAAMQARTGFSYGAGDMKDPIRVRISMVDISTGIFVSHATLAALFKRISKKTAGQHIDLSLMHCITAIQGPKYAEFVASDGEPTKELYAAIGIYKTKDGAIALSAMKDQHVTSLITLINKQSLLNEKNFSRQELRHKNQDALRAIIEIELAKNTTAHWLSAMQKIDLIAQPVQSYEQFMKDPQALAYTLFQTADLGFDKPLPIVRMPGLFPDEATLSPPPTLGEHNDEILHS